MPTSVISSVPKEAESKAEAADEPPTELLDSESPKEASCTVADLIEEEEEEPESAEKKEEAMEEDKVDKKEEEESKDKEEESEEDISKEEEKEEKKAEEKRSQPTENKSAAELAYEWDDEGVEEEKPKTPKKVIKSLK